ncbi:MAG: Na/Pi cotransporter family protein, partial [Clostridia bacterium]
MSLEMAMGLMGGLGLFLYGMKMMSEGLEKTAGDKLRQLLGILTRNRFLSVIVGALFTAVIQSSSATTVMVVGFVNAELMNLLQAAGVIMGANLGTSITGQLVAFQLDTVAPLILLVGVVLLVFFKSIRVQRIGQIIAGFGVLFVGMGMMSGAMEPLRTDQSFIAVMHTLGDNPIKAVLIGIAVTSVIQSSSASVALTQLLAAQGLIPLDMAIYVCLGCAIGTCVTAMLASMGTSPVARRAAVIHLLFNIFGATLSLVLLQLIPLDRWMQTLAPGDIKRQIANANTLIKLTEIIVFFPFAGVLVKLSGMLVREKMPVHEERKLLYLDDLILTTPPIAVAQALREIERMATISIENLDRAMRALFEKDLSLVEEVGRNEAVIVFLNHEITGYLIKIGQTALSPDDVRLVASLYHVINDLERVGDHAENMGEYATTCVSEKVLFTEEGEQELRDIYADVHRLLLMALEAFHTRDRARLPQTADLEEQIDDKEKEYQQHHVARLTVGQCSPRSGMVFTDMLSNLERVGDHATNIAFS